jgi:mono/diheme cytochrome c family protein
MITILTSCDRQSADQSAMSVAQADQMVQRQSGAMWVVDPSDPGPDVPPAGRSLFDYLVTEQHGDRTVYKVPFPFTALVKKIEQELGSDDRGSPLKRVLIPLNRSLQRHAAKPEYFAYPRAVIGVDSEPPMRAGFSGMFLKDRLFLGYQEKADILEVISYNEAAGRFEFQVVRDYGPDKKPKVLYANRALCTACHQNQSPIFSRPLWDETNANPKIAALLEQQHAELYRFPARQGVDVPNAIDEATDRANELSAYQLLWQEGCERARSPSDSIQCRADLFRFLLQSRLNGSPPALRRLPSYRDQFVPRFAMQWKEKWPQGLRIPNPDLPNRNPLDYVQTISSGSGEQLIPATGYGTTRERAMIRSIFEPTIPREPLSVWSVSSDPHEVMDRVITGLSRFLADADIERLDQFLFQQATGSGAPLRRHQSRCEAEVSNRGRSVDRVKFQCREPEPRSGNHEGGFSMEGVLYLKAGTVAGGTIDRLSTGHGDELIDLKVASGTLTSKGGRHSGRIEVTQKEPRLHVRLADGHAITELTFQFDAAREKRPTRHPAGFTGSATMTVVEDYRSIDQAIDAMARETLAGESDVFARKPFRRASVMKALSRQLMMPPLRWCCEETRNMPAAISMTDQALHDRDLAAHEMNLPPVFKAFHRYCAQCHHEDLAFPPNFLHGSPQQVQEQIQHCAERIFFRLEMWDLAPSARQEAPMPPITSLQRLHLSPEEWAGHADLALLKSYTADLVKSQGGKPVRLEDLATKGYDNLRACVPSAEAAVAVTSGAIRK